MSPLGSNPEMLLRSSWFALLPRQAAFLGSADAHLTSNDSPFAGH
jgi:hypothetical protein